MVAAYAYPIMENILKEEIEMKDFGKLALVGFIGYVVGFYEFKYKAQNALLKAMLDKNVEEKAQD